jgi:integrase
MALHQLQVGELLTLGTGFHSDGGNLYLHVSPNKTGDNLNRRWIFRFQRGPRLRDMGLGSLLDLGANSTGLAFVRNLAAEKRRLLAQGIDPIEQRRGQQQKNVTHKRVPTFDEMVREYIVDHRSEWRSAKHGRQWETTLRDYASPVIGKLPVNQIDIADVKKVLAPIWETKTETAKRVRNRIELVLDSAAAHKHRSTENPAAWRALKPLLAKPSKVARVAHHPAMPYRDVGAFVAELRQRKKSIAALALEFCILTCARTDEVLKAKLHEVNFDQARWIVPAGRIKSEREHTVPLSKRALEILHDVRTITKGIGDEVGASDYLFPNSQNGKHLSSNALLALLQIRMKRPGLTVHGFRSSFRDWVSETTTFPDTLAELAIAHQVGEKTERAYRRGSQFQKRIQLAEAWSAYCGKPYMTHSTVLKFRRG